MKKYIIALIMFMLLNLPAISISAEEPETGEAYGLVAAISDAEVYMPCGTENGVTRGQFTAAAVMAFNCDLGIKDPISFNDVKPDSELYPILETAAAYKLVSDGDSFRPDDKIQLYECVKICSIAAGYELKAEVMGGYPTGYLSIATDMGILSDLGNTENGVSADTAYKILFNTLNSDALFQIGFGDTTEFAESKDETLLAKLYKIYKTKGILNANEYTQLGNEKADVMKGTIQIEGESYDVGDDFNNYLGYRVIAYYRSDNEGDTIVYMYPKDNNTLTIQSENAVYSDFTVKYDKDGKEVKADLKRGFDYVYNGKVFYGYTDDDFVPETGELILVDNNNDGKYDIVYAKNYYYMTAKVINKLEMVIYDDEDSGKRLDLSEPDCIYSIYDKEDEEYISLSKMQNESVLAVQRSKDNKMISVIICNDIVSGIVTEININENYILIDGVSYKISQDLKENNQGIKAGTNCSFYLGNYGELVMIANKSTNMDYAYLTDAQVESKIGGRLSVKFFTQKEEFLILTCAERIMLDGEPSKTASQALSALQSNGVVKPQLIKYAVNEKGELSKLDLAQEATNLLDAKNDFADNSLRKYAFASSYNFRQQIFYPYFNAGSSIVFKIPTDVTDEEGFSIGYSFTDGDYTTVTPYDVGLDGSADALVFVSDKQTMTMSADTEIVLVEKTVRAINDDGESLEKVIGWENGKFVEYFFEDSVEVLKKGKASKLHGGDIIRIARKNDEITGLVVDFNGETLSQNTGTDIAPFNGKSSNLQYQAGKLFSYQNGYIYLSNTLDSSGRYDFSSINLKNVKLPGVIAIYDVKSGTIRPADSSYIKTYQGAGEDASYVVVKQNYMYSNFAVVYNGLVREGR